MEIIFNEEYLREMYNTGRTDKKHRFQPQIIRKDDKAGLSSVRVNDQYRIEFEEHTKDGETVATICNITDLSNHYK